MLARYFGKGWTRRSFLGLSGTALVSSLISSRQASAAEMFRSLDESAAGSSSAQEVVKRVLGSYAKQIHLRLLSPSETESFQIAGSSGKILVEGSSQSSLLMGVNWYLKYVVGVSTSWNGDCLDLLPATLPAPSSPVRQKANVHHRFALNDTNDGYTGPYWSWEQWERQIDILALHGINEVLVYMGAEAVYQQTFLKFGYSDPELSHWFPTPAHQPWWLLENMSGWVGPSVSQQLIDARADLGAKITRRLRELGMKPVLPGYFGIVPDSFVEKNPDARIMSQGKWLGMKRPDWLDPSCRIFDQVAEEFYRVQEQLLGPATMFKMDPLHEGGKAGDIDITVASRNIYKQLQRAHPGAVWTVLGWQENPRRELLAAIEDKSHVLILDGLSDRYAYRDREQQWDHTPYAFGVIWNFGGRTTIGANVGVWNERYFYQLTKTDSKLNGIAVMPEASCNNPAAFAFVTELAWRHHPPDLVLWFRQWAAYRYGEKDRNADAAWDLLRATAYNGKSGKFSTAHDNLFSAQPDLAAKGACPFSPQEARYDIAVFANAIGNLLQVHPSLRASSAYRYDLVDVARQTIANDSRVLLPKIDAAYRAANIQEFRQLTQHWLEQISRLERVVGTHPAFLLGPWLAAAKAAAKSSVEEEQLEFDARSLLLEWGPLVSCNSGVHDYANREWHGLLDFYRKRWSLYFDALEESIHQGTPVKKIDWFSIDQAWSKQTNQYPVDPIGDPYEVVKSTIIVQ